MLKQLPIRAKSESGFTLVELLVVMLIIGLLAAIAIPAFFNQREKATDSAAKEAVRTAQTALETYSTDNGGSYALADLTKLQAIEPTVDDSTVITASDGVAAVGQDNYQVTVTSESGGEFSINRDTNSNLTYPCTGDTGGCNGGFWN